MARRKAGSTHCLSGKHLWTDENTAVDENGFTICRLCRNARKREWYKRMRSKFKLAWVEKVA